MIKERLCKQQKGLILSIFLITALFLAAFTRSFVRIQTTLIGYKLGELKMLEENLLEQRALLQMELAKVTTKEHLMNLSIKEKNPSTVASFAVH